MTREAGVEEFQEGKTIPPWGCSRSKRIGRSRWGAIEAGLTVLTIRI